MTEENSGIITEQQVLQVIEENKVRLQKSLEDTIAKLLESYPEKMEQTGKGELKCIYISLLLTSVPFRMPLYRIDFYDENERLDLIEHADYWNISPVNKIVYTDVFTDPKAIRRLNDKENYINEQNWFENVKVLHGYFSEYSEGIAVNILVELGIESVNIKIEKYL